MSTGPGQVPTRLGRYELITRIAEGGMADVQLALQRGPAGFEKLVVVKLVHEKLAAEKAFVDMLLDEARVAALLKHRNVVDIYDLGEVDGRYFIAMEYLAGEPLLAVLRAGREGKRLDVHSTARLVADTAEGLAAAHALRSMAGKPLELVHHDISLGNIVVLYTGEVKLVDFGVAKAARTRSKKTDGAVQGKFGYMAPEKLGGADGDRRSDIFSLGVVLWEALTLRRLFKGATDEETTQQVLAAEVPRPSTVNPDVPAEYDAIVLRTLARDADARYQTARELADALEEVLAAHRYPRKNDAIAQYMQATFATHIAARQRVVQEVTSKGTTTQELLAAAFVAPIDATADSVVAATKGSRDEFSVRFRAASTRIAVVGDASAEPGEPRALQTEPDPELLAELARPRIDTPTGSAPLDAWDGSKPPMRPPTEAEPGDGTAAAPSRSRRRFALFAILFGGFVLLIIILASTVGGSGNHEAAPVDAAKTVASAVVLDAAPPAPPPPPVDAAEVVDIDAAPTVVEPPAPEPDAAPPPPHHEAHAPAGKPKPPPPVVVAPPPPPANSPEAFERQAREAYARGDNQGALDAIRKAQHLDPQYAPAWRTLGQVYARMGERAQARIAYVRYLQLAPSAPDAGATKADLDALNH